MTFTKLASRVAAVLTVAAFAAPALPCTDAKQTQAMSTPAPATTDPGTTKTPKDAVAKQTRLPDKAKHQGKKTTATTKVTVAN